MAKKTFLKDSTDNSYPVYDDSGTDKILEAPDETALAPGKYIVEVDGGPATDPNDDDKPFKIEVI